MSEIKSDDKLVAPQVGGEDVASPPSVTSGQKLPQLVEHQPVGARQRWTRIGILLLLAGASLGGVYWQMHRVAPLPAYIVYGNGRLEADPIDIATKFAGRILELRADEGDMVKAGQVVALMDVRDLDASLKKSQSQAEAAAKAVSEAQANIDQLRSQTVLAQQEMDRAKGLIKNGWITKELFDQRQQQVNAAISAQSAAESRLNAAQHALEAAQHDAEMIQVNINDNTLVAPRDGRIEYRIANIAEVLAAGGKVFTMLDTSYVYMDIYLPTLNANRIQIGDEARIVLDAYPDRPIPAKVSFLADQAQFTPKMVETKTDRDKLMFRIRVRVDPDLARSHAQEVRSGLPGVAYLKTDRAGAWPASLTVKTPTPEKP